MDCPPGIHTCIDSLFHVETKAPGVESNALPPCYSEWKPLPTPVPAGSYALVFTGRVTEKGAILTLVTAEGKLLASLHYPDERSWECEKPTKIGG